MKKASAVLLCVFIPLLGSAQFLIIKNENELGISGMITTLYNNNILKPGITDKSRNSFYLRDAQIEIEGKFKKNYEFKLQVDFADWISGISDPETPGLMDAYVLYSGLKFVDVKLGYQKLAFSRNSMVSFAYSPYFHRSDFTKGEVFSHRDLGITLKRGFLEDKIKLFAGIYTGMGESCFSLPNDKSGKPEYLARVEFSYPGNLKYREIDIDKTEIFSFAIGLNERYAEKESYTGNEYYIKTINGKKSLYGIDIYCRYKGFSFSMEANQARLRPNNTDLNMGYKTNFIMAGGWLMQANYYFAALNSSISGRYDESNLNDLIPGKYAANTFSYMYFLKHFDSVIRLNFTSLKSEEPLPGSNSKKWNKQFTIGWQFLFN